MGAETYTSLKIKGTNSDEFKKWFDKEMGATYRSDPSDGWDLCYEIEDGIQNYFWEYFSLKMACVFEGIVFDGITNLYWGDHTLKTKFNCDGNEVVITKSIEIPDYDDDEPKEYYGDEPDEKIEEELDEEVMYQLNMWEADYDMPYLVKFSVETIANCNKVYGEVNKKLKDSDLVESTCSKYNVSKELFLDFANIYNYKKRI